MCNADHDLLSPMRFSIVPVNDPFPEIRIGLIHQQGLTLEYYVYYVMSHLYLHLYWYQVVILHQLTHPLMLICPLVDQVVMITGCYYHLRVGEVMTHQSFDSYHVIIAFPHPLFPPSLPFSLVDR